MTRDQTAVVIDRAVLEREVVRVIAAASAGGAPIRVLGSIGVALHSPDAATLLPAFERTYADIDFAAYRRDARSISAAVAGLGYVEARDVFIASEGLRAIFRHPVSRIHLDVFFDRLEFCHVIPLAGRLEVDEPTIPLAELLLSKLQIVKLNHKDVVDIVLLLLDHRLGTGDADTIDIGRVAGLCGDDWGLWRTLTMNLEKVASLASTYPQLTPPQRDWVITATASIKREIDAIPKSFGWRMRDRVGDRRQWWTDVDEVR